MSCFFPTLLLTGHCCGLPTLAREYADNADENERALTIHYPVLVRYVIPTAPYVVNGVERGSGTNAEYALRDLPPNNLKGFDAARAYLKYPEEQGVNLRNNYFQIITAVGDQLERGVGLTYLMGHLDDSKLVSSVRLFEFISREDPALQDVNAACLRVLLLLEEDPMSAANPPTAKPSTGDSATAASETGETKDVVGDEAAGAALAEQLDRMGLERMKPLEEL